MGDMVRVRFQNNADLPSYIDLKVGHVYEMEDYSETHFLWCGVHSFCKWRFDLLEKEETTLEEKVAELLTAYDSIAARLLAERIVKMVRES